MVTGTVTGIASKALPVTCHGAQEYRILCGPQARYFEPKFKETDVTLIEALKAIAPAVGDGSSFPSTRMSGMSIRAPSAPLYAVKGDMSVQVNLLDGVSPSFIVRYDALMRTMDREGVTLTAHEGSGGVIVRAGRNRESRSGVSIQNRFRKVFRLRQTVCRCRSERRVQRPRSPTCPSSSARTIITSGKWAFTSGIQSPMPSGRSRASAGISPCRSICPFPVGCRGFILAQDGVRNCWAGQARSGRSGRT